MVTSTLRKYLSVLSLTLVTHEILVLIAYAQIFPINAHAGVSSEARGKNFGLSLILQSNFVCVQRRLWHVGANAQTPLGIRCSLMRYVAKYRAMTLISYC